MFVFSMKIIALAEGRSWSEETSSARDWTPPVANNYSSSNSSGNSDKSKVSGVSYKSGGSDMEDMYGLSK
jgi:hypothetical protein